ncbi:MAG: Hsp20/alpha crystallin family protein [Desulfatitalea sp.]|nr:Hsp20/alpha crystallin family protein [Desulfatitalea sp.]
MTPATATITSNSIWEGDPTEMGTRKIDLRSAPQNYQQAVNEVFDSAFGPSRALYRQISLCGWRPLFDLATPLSTDHLHSDQAFADTSTTATSVIAVYETADGMTVEVALSHINEESLHLAVAGKRLVIRGERLLYPHSRRDCGLFMESCTRFQQFVPIPTSVNAGGFRAQVEGNVVRIEFAKAR